MHNLLIVMFVVLLIGACIGGAYSGNPAKNPEQEIKPVENFQVVGEWQKVHVPLCSMTHVGVIVDKKLEWSTSCVTPHRMMASRLHHGCRR